MSNCFKFKSGILIFTALIMFTSGIFYPKQADASLASGITDMLNQLLIIIDPIIPAYLQEDVRLANTDADYANLGLEKGTIELWEDGLRMDLDPEEFGFEWWYFDGTFADGSAFVASFYSKMELDLTRPFIKLTINTPDGQNILRSMWGDHAESSFSADQCDLNIGADNVVYSNDGATYYIKAQVEDLAVDLVLEKTVRSFRQDTGHVLIGDDEEQYLGWFSMVPKGTLHGTITYNGATHNVSGTGYHDHNWGTAKMQEVLKEWWWMRGYVDDMAIISYYFSFKNKYGAKKIPIYGIMNSTDVLAAYNTSKTTTVTGNDWGFPDVPDYSTCLSDRIPFEMDLQTGTWWNCWTGNNCIQVQFISEDMIESIDLLAMQNLSETEMSMMKLLSFDPWYLRYNGEVNLEVQNFNGWSTSGSGTAIIEYLDLE